MHLSLLEPFADTEFTRSTEKSYKLQHTLMSFLINHLDIQPDLLQAVNSPTKEPALPIGSSSSLQFLFKQEVSLLPGLHEGYLALTPSETWRVWPHAYRHLQCLGSC